MKDAAPLILRPLRLRAFLMIWILIALAATSSLAALGDSTADLVYTPVTPCRVLDTRIAAIPQLIGPITIGSTIDIAINDADALIAAQGGHENGCPDVPISPEPAAVALTITAVPTPRGAGHLRAFAFQSLRPLISVLNWGLGRNVANTTITPTCVDCGPDISIYVGGDGNADIVVDIVGYFGAPQPTPPQINVLRHSDTAEPSQDIFIYSPVCPSGYRLTGGGFHAPHVTHYGSRPALHGTSQSAIGVDIANAWMCEGRNDTDNLLDVNCYVVCARLPAAD